jgi:hypothetical protein
VVVQVRLVTLALERTGSLQRAHTHTAHTRLASCALGHVVAAVRRSRAPDAHLAAAVIARVVWVHLRCAWCGVVHRQRCESRAAWQALRRQSTRARLRCRCAKEPRAAWRRAGALVGPTPRCAPARRQTRAQPARTRTPCTPAGRGCRRQPCPAGPAAGEQAHTKSIVEWRRVPWHG